MEISIHFQIIFFLGGGRIAVVVDTNHFIVACLSQQNCEWGLGGWFFGFTSEMEYDAVQRIFRISIKDRIDFIIVD